MTKRNNIYLENMEQSQESKPAEAADQSVVEFQQKIDLLHTNILLVSSLGIQSTLAKGFEPNPQKLHQRQHIKNRRMNR